MGQTGEARKADQTLGVPGIVDPKASLGRQVLEPEEWPSSSLMGDIAAPIDAAVGC